MTIARVRGAGWPTLAELLSSEITQVDINTSLAVDRRAGALEIDSQDFSLWEPLHPVYIGSCWSFNIVPGNLAWFLYESNVAAGDLLLGFQICNSRSRGTLKSVTIYMCGARNGAGHSAFPTNMPSFKLVSQSTIATGNGTALQTVNSVANGNFGDGPTNFSNVIGNYDAAWSVVMSAGGTGFGDRSHAASGIIYLLITGESGANALNNDLSVMGIKTTWTSTGMYPNG